MPPSHGRLVTSELHGHISAVHDLRVGLLNIYRITGPCRFVISAPPQVYYAISTEKPYPSVQYDAPNRLTDPEISHFFLLIHVILSALLKVRC